MNTEKAPEERRRLPRWKQVMLGLAALSVSFGLALGRFESSPDAAPEETLAQADPGSTAGRRAVPGDASPSPRVEGMAATNSDGPDAGSPALEAGTALESEALAYGTQHLGASGFVPGARLDTPTALVALSANEPADSNTSAEPREPRAQLTHTARPRSSGGSSSAPWSPLFVKGGLSVFAGFCVGHALRAFFKLSAIALGLAFMAALGLQYYGVLNLDWSAVSDLYDVAAVRVSSELESLGTFLNGSVPSAGLASFGLFAGFKRS